MKRTKVIIDRQKWSRGKLGSNALLVDAQIKMDAFGENPPKVGTMCCLGFACRALGAKLKDIRGKQIPGLVDVPLPGLTEDGYDTKFSDEAAAINDDGTLTDEAREKKLIARAAASEFEFVFIN